MSAIGPLLAFSRQSRKPAAMNTWFQTYRGPIFARTWGDVSRPRLLLLHGFPEYSGAWSDLAPKLAHKFHCIAPDQRGYGQTGGPDEIAAYTTSALVQDMVEVIGEEPVTVLGHDWGSAVAYGLAMFAPQLVERLIILNGVHPVPFQRALSKGGAQTRASAYINTLRADGSETHLAQKQLRQADATLLGKYGSGLADPEETRRLPGRVDKARTPKNHDPLVSGLSTQTGRA